jgi:hypothetical protein
MPLVVEGLLTTVHQGRVNLAPMGPIVEADWRRLILRPFPGSTTCDNLLASRVAVFHVTDDVELLARAATGAVDPLPGMSECPSIPGWILRDACRWYALRVSELDATPPRYTLTCEVVERGAQRDFLGLNRAQHAVVEAAILATRRHLVPAAETHRELARLQPLVEKTGGPVELRAWQHLTRFLEFRAADG